MEKHNCKKCINVCDCCVFKERLDNCNKCVPVGSRMIMGSGIERCPKNNQKLDRCASQIFKPGDAVVIRKDLDIDKHYYMINSGQWDGTSDEMLYFRGKTVHIQSSDKHGYTIKEDIEGWNWTDEMFELEDFERD